MEILEQYKLSKEEYYKFFSDEKETVLFKSPIEFFFAIFLFNPITENLTVIVREQAGRKAEFIHTFYSNIPVDDPNLQKAELYYIEKFKKEIRKEKQLEVSIDMSIDDSTAENRIYGRVIDKQDNILLCEFNSANYDCGINSEGGKNAG